MKNLKQTIANWWNNIFDTPSEKEQNSNEEVVQNEVINLENPNQWNPMMANRWTVELADIPAWYFSSYKYMGTDIHTQKKLLTSAKVISEDYSVFKVVMCEPSQGFDISEKLKDLELNPIIGDVKIKILGPTGHVVKTILIPDCEVTEIRAFRELSYDNNGILYGEIVVKHKQRKLL